MATQITLHHSPTDRFLGRCTPCVRPIATDLPQERRDFVTIACPECGLPVRLERIYGCFSSMQCDPRCEGAIGPICECSCGGVNHGGAYGLHQEPDALASAVAKHRDTHAKRMAAVAERQAKAAAERSAREAATWAEREAAEAEAQEAYEAENAGTLSALAAYQGKSDFILSIRDQAASGRRLSPRQLESVASALTREAGWAAQREAERAALAQANAEAAGVDNRPAPQGRIKIMGVVLSVQERETEYGATWKMLVRTDGGRKVWSTVPRALIEAVEEPEALKGRRIGFMAEVKQSDEDPAFWLAYRPGQALVLAEGIQVS